MNEIICQYSSGPTYSTTCTLMGEGIKKELIYPAATLFEIKLTELLKKKEIEFNLCLKIIEDFFYITILYYAEEEINVVEELVEKAAVETKLKPINGSVLVRNKKTS